MTLRGDDEVIAAEIAKDDSDLLVVTENGFGKRTRVSEYPLKGRGGMGVRTVQLTEARGKLAGARVVRDGYQVMLISNGGTVIRMSVDEVKRLGRSTQGVIVMRLREGEQVVALAPVVESDDDTARLETSRARPPTAAAGARRSTRRRCPSMTTYDEDSRSRRRRRRRRRVVGAVRSSAAAVSGATGSMKTPAPSSSPARRVVRGKTSRCQCGPSCSQTLIGTKPSRIDVKPPRQLRDEPQRRAEQVAFQPDGSARSG